MPDEDEDEDEGPGAGDPTARTLANARREIKGLRELVEAKLGALDRLTTTRFEAVESVRLEQKGDTQQRIDAALSAADKASAKTETTVAKQLEQLAANFDAVVKRLDDRITAVETRVSKTEAGVGL